MRPTLLPWVAGVWLLSACGPPSSTLPGKTLEPSAVPARIRIALFNIRELSTGKIYAVDAEGRGTDPQALAAARVIRQVRPDILVLNEIDHDYQALDKGLDWSARRFRDAYLRTGTDGLELPFSFAAACNTGLLSGLDLDGNGLAATTADLGSRAHGNDSWGYGTYPGQYSMAVLSRFPIDADHARTFQTFLWKDLPGHHMPADHFKSEIAELLRLSSKSHWDLPIEIGGRSLHLWVSHPTPQGFDGPEDKNGRRNFDEIKLWVEYLGNSAALGDDQGGIGGYDSSEPFVVIGDLNARPVVRSADAAKTAESGGSDGPFRTSTYDGQVAIDQLLRHPRIQDSGAFMTSLGALAHNTDEPRPPGPPLFYERSTSVFGDGARIDYILPSAGLEIVSGGVFWPAPAENDEGARWADEASDHRLVWLDILVGSSGP